MNNRRKPILVLTLDHSTSIQRSDEMRDRLKKILNDEYVALILQGKEQKVELLSTRKISKKKYTTLLNLINKND